MITYNNVLLKVMNFELKLCISLRGTCGGVIYFKKISN